MTRHFSRWARANDVTESALVQSTNEISAGLVDARLGAGVLKKRIGLSGRGKRGGARTLLVYQDGYRAIFVHGFAKNQKDNLSAPEVRALRRLASELLTMDDVRLGLAITAGEMIEVKSDAQDRS